MKLCLSLRSPWPNVTIPEANVADYVWENVAQYSDNTALVCGLTGRLEEDVGGQSTCIIWPGLTPTELPAVWQ